MEASAPLEVRTTGAAVVPGDLLLTGSAQRRNAKVQGTILTTFDANTSLPKGTSPLPAKNDAGTQEHRMTNKTIGR